MKNPIELLKMIKNPKQYVINMAKQTPNPMLNNLIEMAEKGQNDKIEEFARNLYAQQGKNFGQEFNNFKDMFK